MKKDYLILVSFLAIMLISGGVVYVVKSPTAEKAVNTGGGPADIEAELRMRITRLEGQLISDPNNLQVLTDLGNAYYDMNEPAKSIEYYEKSLAIKPVNPPVLVDCGVMYRALNNADRALEMFDRAIALDPGFPQAYFNKGTVLRMEKNDRDGAAEAWKKYLELEPNVDPQVKNLLESEIRAVSGS